MIVINIDIMICIMCDVLLLKCAPSVVLMFKYVLCILLESNIPPFFVRPCLNTQLIIPILKHWASHVYL
jgi:hypothetical protein